MFFLQHSQMKRLWTWFIDFELVNTCVPAWRFSPLCCTLRGHPWLYRHLHRIHLEARCWSRLIYVRAPTCVVASGWKFVQHLRSVDEQAGEPRKDIIGNKFVRWAARGLRTSLVSVNRIGVTTNLRQWDRAVRVVAEMIDWSGYGWHTKYVIPNHRLKPSYESYELLCLHSVWSEIDFNSTYTGDHSTTPPPSSSLKRQSSYFFSLRKEL